VEPLTSPAELKRQIELERRGRPFLVYRDGDGAQRIAELGDAPERLTLGRSPSAAVPLSWDADVSRVHAELQRVGDVWAVVDDGLSRNGTFVNGERVSGRRRLADGDRLRCGRTALLYRAPAEAAFTSTAVAADAAAVRISDAQRRVLVALARPYAGGDAYATPASNPQIAAELHLSVEAVKTHVRALFQKFGVEDLPQNQKRARLVALAFQSGEISRRDLQPR
jgi:hypothetical protein